MNTDIFTASQINEIQIALLHKRRPHLPLNLNPKHRMRPRTLSVHPCRRIMSVRLPTPQDTQTLLQRLDSDLRKPLHSKLVSVLEQRQRVYCFFREQVEDQLVVDLKVTAGQIEIFRSLGLDLREEVS